MVYGVLSWYHEGAGFGVRACKTEEEYYALLMELMFNPHTTIKDTVILTPPNPT
jgi:hypothetical protein